MKSLLHKIVIGLVKILKKEIDHFELGNIYAKRDCTCKRIRAAMWKMLQRKNQMIISFLLKTYSIKDFSKFCYLHLGMDVKMGW